MIDYGLYPAGIKDPIFVPGDQIGDGRRGCNLVTENRIEVQYVYIVRWIINAVGIENLFSNCFSHDLPQKDVLLLNIFITGTVYVQAQYKAYGTPAAFGISRLDLIYSCVQKAQGAWCRNKIIASLDALGGCGFR